MCGGMDPSSQADAQALGQAAEHHRELNETFRDSEGESGWRGKRVSSEIIDEPQDKGSLGFGMLGA